MASRSRSASPTAAERRASSSICGQGLSGLTWSGVTGETPPQSSMPARSTRSYSPSMRFGGAWMRALGPRTRRATAIGAGRACSSAPGLARLGGARLAREFCTMDSRVQVRQQPGLFQYRDRAGPYIVHCGLVAALLQPCLGLWPPVLGPVAEREEGLLASLRGTGAGDVEYLVALQVRGRQAVRHRGESAVVATVPAQPGERDEDLLRVRDDARPTGVDQPGIAYRTGDGEQLVQCRTAGVQQDRRFGDVQWQPLRRPVQGPSQAGFGRFTHLCSLCRPAPGRWWRTPRSAPAGPADGVPSGRRGAHADQPQRWVGSPPGWLAGGRGGSAWVRSLFSSESPLSSDGGGAAGGAEDGATGATGAVGGCVW